MLQRLKHTLQPQQKIEHAYVPGLLAWRPTAAMEQLKVVISSVPSPCISLEGWGLCFVRLLYFQLLTLLLRLLPTCVRFQAHLHAAMQPQLFARPNRHDGRRQAGLVCGHTPFRHRAPPPCTSFSCS